MVPRAPVPTFAFRVAGTCGLSSRVMSSTAKISTRVSLPSLLMLSSEMASNDSLSVGDFQCASLLQVCLAADFF